MKNFCLKNSKQFTASSLVYNRENQSSGVPAMAHELAPGVSLVTDLPHAPFVFFESAPTFGVMSGVLNITLAATRTVIGPGGILTDHVVTAYLRGNVSAMLSLKDAIEGAMLLAQHPTEDEDKLEGKPMN